MPNKLGLWAALVLAAAVVAHAGERPNILWVTAEDFGLNLGSYGDPDAVTPHLDAFARTAIRFTHVYSIHPCCSPSRSALQTGVYPTRLGTFQHRSTMWVDPAEVKGFTTVLRDAGYYCFNGLKDAASKQDYNFTPRDQPWDVVGAKGIFWRRRQPGQPFFGQVNLPVTHQSHYGNHDGNRNFAPESFRVHNPATLRIPAYHPDLPAVREIWREYHDRATEMDAMFGEVMDKLRQDKLDEDTIVFFFGDNGVGIPGGKIWLWDQGVHVPLLVYFPPKWAHLAAGKSARVDDRLVSFIDFAPTVLTLVGVPVPAYMEGQSYLGEHPAAARECLYAARDFHDGAAFDGSRMVRDARYHYIWNLMPHLGWDPILFAWKKAPAMLEEWRAAAEAGRLAAGTRQAAFFSRSKPAEELYDMQTDPAQMHNLAADPRHRAVLEQLRARCEAWMVNEGDLGLLSQYELYHRALAAGTPYRLSAEMKQGLTRRLIAAAKLAGRRDPQAIPELTALLRDPDAALRRWGAIGLLALGARADSAKSSLAAALTDTSPDVRMTAAEALTSLGQADAALPILADLLGHESRIIRNETLQVLARIGPPARAVLPQLDRALSASKEDNDLWSYDNIPDAVKLARAMIDPDSKDPIRLTHLRYLP